MGDPNAPKPTTGAQYRDWLRVERGVEIAPKDLTHYDAVVRRLADQTQNSQFWTTLIRNLEEHDQEYFKNAGSTLLAHHQAKIVWKPFTSMLDKSYRKNVLDNENWNDPPKTGWITPANWLSEINDPVRTTFVARYLDGVPWFASVLERLASDLHVPFRVDYEAREEGYYAGHVYVILEGEIPSLLWNTEIVRYSFEIQITTQIQDVIRPLTHPFYVERRSKLGALSKKWQWDYDSEEFGANYLAHTLHHVEGLIVGVRDKRRKKSAGV